MFFEGLGTFLVVIIILVIVLAIVSSCVRIVPQARALVVERLGGYLGTYGVGLHILVPFIDRVARKVDHGPQAVRLRRGASPAGHREPDGYHAAKHHRRSGAG